MHRTLCLSVILFLHAAVSQALDLSNAVVVMPAEFSAQEKKAVSMLVEEVEKRTQVRWPIQNSWPGSDGPVIAIASQTRKSSLIGHFSTQVNDKTNLPEGFRLVASAGQGSIPSVFIIGNDARGVLFGIGKLLRQLHMGRRTVSIADKLDLTSAPKYALRGHQLGYRPKCNSYDAWDLPVWEQYFRDLAVFGSNAIELIPPRSDDDADSPHFPRPPMEMMVGMSALADAYGLDVWIWYPAMDKDYLNPQTIQFALEQWAEVFKRVPRLDAVFVPGGDPGHTQPKYLMALLEQQTKNLHRYHPKAQMWVSPQGFTQAWLDEFIEILKRENPTWLSGIVYGPQVRVPLAQLRNLVPLKYPIRHYPDITHSRQCQFPVPDWDVAFAITEARECINPRPESEAAIFRKLQPDSIGFLSYSEGCNDDVNKIVWSGLGWDPTTPVKDILRDYGQYFMGERYAENFADGLLALEKNWHGSARTNNSIDVTLAHFQMMEKDAPPADLKNWRFQQALFRAYYDAHVRRRLIHETDSEERTLRILQSAGSYGSLAAIARAEDVLNEPLNDPLASQWRTRIYQLAEALFQSVGMQLSVEHYRAIAVDRGASLDTLEYPLNNRLWLKGQFNHIRQLPSEPARVQALAELAHWTNPGPGGYYDDLGNTALQPHLVPGLAFNEDPERMASSRVDFEEDLVVDEPDEKPEVARRVSWIDHVESLYDTPLQMRYTGLDPSAKYKLRVVYGGDNFKRKMRLVANKEVEIHPYVLRPFPIKPMEFSVPKSATASGELNLSWFGEPGLGGNGRNCQVSEVWLLKQSASSNP